MSKKAKLLAKARNKSKKRSIRDANRERYREQAEKGTNKKKKGKDAKKKFNPVPHSTSNCGNVGCKKCSPLKFPFKTGRGFQKKSPHTRVLYLKRVGII